MAALIFTTIAVGPYAFGPAIYGLDARGAVWAFDSLAGAWQPMPMERADDAKPTRQREGV